MSAEPLFHAKITSYEPPAPNSKKPGKKRELISRIKEKYDISDDLRQRCRGKEVLVDVRYHLYKPDSKSESESRWKKDLDNLLKVSLDVLQERIDTQTQVMTGLGLIDNDDSIFGICCSKDYVYDKIEEGVEITIYNARLVRMKLERK